MQGQGYSACVRSSSFSKNAPLFLREILSICRRSFLLKNSLSFSLAVFFLIFEQHFTADDDQRDINTLSPVDLADDRLEFVVSDRYSSSVHRIRKTCLLFSKTQQNKENELASTVGIAFIITWTTNSFDPITV